MSSAPALPQSDNFRRIAHPLHTAIVLLAAGAGALQSALHADEMRNAADLDRVRMYERTILMEWALMGLIVVGLKIAGTPLTAVFGERWRSLRALARDFGIGVAYSFLSVMVVSILGAHAHSAQTDRAVQFLLPHGRTEMTWWIALSISAGICEEAIYRGYFQRQFMAFTKSPALGILIPALLFGLAHSYQGIWGALPIAMDGALLGLLAYWRKSVRPGMIAHAWKDAWAPLLMSLPRH